MLTIDPPASGIFGTHARTKFVTLVKFSRISASWPLSFTSRNAGLEPAARVVDEHVDAVERRDPRAHRVAVAHVEQLGVHVPARGRDLAGGAGQTVGVAVADRDVGAEAGERDRDRRRRCPGPRR